MVFSIDRVISIDGNFYRFMIVMLGVGIWSTMPESFSFLTGKLGLKPCQYSWYCYDILVSLQTVSVITGEVNYGFLSSSHDINCIIMTHHKSMMTL